MTVNQRVWHKGLLVLSYCGKRKGNLDLPGFRGQRNRPQMESCGLLPSPWLGWISAICLHLSVQKAKFLPSHPPTFPSTTHSRLQNTFYFIVSLLIGYKLWNFPPHQKQSTSCCMGTYFSAQSRCYCLKIPNKTPLATIKSIDLEALYNFQSKWH